MSNDNNTGIRPHHAPHQQPASAPNCLDKEQDKDDDLEQLPLIIDNNQDHGDRSSITIFDATPCCRDHREFRHKLFPKVALGVLIVAACLVLSSRSMPNDKLAQVTDDLLPSFDSSMTTSTSGDQSDISADQDELPFANKDHDTNPKLDSLGDKEENSGEAGQRVEDPILEGSETPGPQSMETTNAAEQIVVDHLPETETPTIQPKGDTTTGIFNNTIADELQVPHVVYDDLHYRRICAPVGVGSVLCMTVKFPFPLPVQDPQVHWPSPFEPKFYSIDRSQGVVIVDEAAVQQCEMKTLDVTMDEAVQQCLEETAAANNNDSVVAVWTRQRYDGTTYFHSTSLPENVNTIYDYFGDDHLIFVMGMSPSGGVVKQMLSVFGKLCHLTGANGHEGNWNCDRAPPTNQRRGRRVLPLLPYNTVEEGHVNFGKLNHGPYTHGTNHRMPDLNLTQVLASLNIRTDEARQRKPKRLVSILVEYPIAHTQSEPLILENPSYVQELNENFVASLMVYLQTDSAKQELADLGLELGNMLVFDGLPQYFPTETAAYRSELTQHQSEDIFLQHNGYDGWHTEFGSSCRGPLPPNSPLKDVAMNIRQVWMDQGFDMRWYGRTWEFANMFWFQTQMWQGKDGRLDCTHSVGAGVQGTYAMHKFLVQAMLDDYFETMHAS